MFDQWSEKNHETDVVILILVSVASAGLLMAFAEFRAWFP